MAFKQCYWLYAASDLTGIPENAIPISTNEVGAQSMNSLYDAVGVDDVVSVDLYQDNYGGIFAAVGFTDASILVLRRSCVGSTVSPYMVGIGLGALIGGLIGGKWKRLSRYRPASTLIGVALGLVTGGVTSHLLVKRSTGTVAGCRGCGNRVGTTFARKKMPMRSVGALYLPQDGGLPRDTRVGLIDASKRYMPRGKNW